MKVHVSLKVASLERSKAFYSKLFGQETSKAREDYANFRLDEPPIHLALMEGEPACCSGLSHLGFELSDHGALDDWRSRLEKAGVGFVPEDEAACCYARADKLWIGDPDGYRWEIWVRTGEHDAMGRAPVLEEIVRAENSACCEQTACC
ncbi:MAG: glyoxalase/bleomycin resistance/dioxygenase family protein [Xanthomonadales bacterium]|nr:glyoxalase/bleomycin resistance/dioxygenase family protein [Xanthomonadales bacterium]NIX13217.1 glyoxalase/bleomycin resistance/dioxygenase family protein [Xanthomonadales bacterium]